MPCGPPEAHVALYSSFYEPPSRNAGEAARRNRTVVTVFREVTRIALSLPSSDTSRISSDGLNRICLISFSSDRTVTLIRGFFWSSRSSWMGLQRHKTGGDSFARFQVVGLNCD